MQFTVSRKQKKQNARRALPTAYRLLPTRAFTLVEMIVAVGLFAIVMLVCVGSLLALVAANQKVQALQSVMNNLNLSLDGMIRTIRMGSIYRCATANSPLTSADCPSSGPIFAFEPYGNSSSDPAWVYSFDSDGSICGQAHSLCRQKGAEAPQPLTAPEVTIDSLQFYVVGTSPADALQPKVVIVIKGTAPVSNSKAKSTFHIQVTAVQRLLDL
jgi:prepilin-type N-terminal cleavage/methylation domain-containing protein